MSILQFPSRQLNKKKIIGLVVICCIILMIIILSLFYFYNFSFRSWVDIHIFRKEIHADNLATITLNADEDQYFYSYDKYITVFDKNILYIYNGSGQLITQNDIAISSPLFASNNKFLVVAENNGNNLFFISGTNIAWQKKIDGSIYKLSVNKNGYVSVIVSGTNYKSVVISFDAKGKELFKTYLSSNMAIDSSISNDNKYLSIAEIDYSGSIIKSVVKNISIEKAKTDPTNSVIYNYNLKENTLLTSIQFQDKNILVCMCNDGIYELHLSDFSDNEVLSSTHYEFTDIHPKNHYLYTENQSHGFSNTSNIYIANIQNNSINQYSLQGSIQSIMTTDDKIAINTGSTIYFVSLNGWLIKKIDSYNEINHILLGNTVAGIVYKNRIEIIEF